MTNSVFTSSSIDFSGVKASSNSVHKEEPGLEQNQNQILSTDDSVEISSPCPELGGYQEEQNDIATKGPNLLDEEHQFDELHANSDFQATQSFQEMPKLVKSFRCSGQEVTKSGNELRTPSALSSSLELLSSYATGFKKLKGNLSSLTTDESNSAGGRKKLSTEDILRVAGARYVQFSDQIHDDVSMVTHPFGYALSGLSEDETRDVELVHLLLASAEKVGYREFERASRLLSRCEWIASERANPVQRIVFNLASALRERIERETGNFTAKESGKNGMSLAEHGIGYNPSTITGYRSLPFTQVMSFTGTQAMLEYIENASKIHFIDFELRSGVQWTSLMQGIADREQSPIQLLKITAVAYASKEVVEETGKSLSSFAESLNLPFQFQVVCVPSFLDIKLELFEIKNDESLIVYCSLILRVMICYPSCLENLFGVIKKLNPTLMVVIEIEANHNSPSFVNRFLETLFFYGAYFDALETCLDDNPVTRTRLEAMLYSGMRNIVAMEGTDRTVRNVKLDVWRAFFSRFRMVEIGLSDQSLFQANLVLKQFPCASSCTLDKNGKSLIIGWKGTPIHSVSVWKFSRERGKAFQKYRF